MEHVNVTFSAVDFRGWKDCLQIENGELEIRIPACIGPRISYLSLRGGENVFCENADAPCVQGDVWHNYGGHRLWHGPQEGDRPAEPDNHPVHVTKTATGVILEQDTEKIARVKKRMELSMHGNQITVDHFLTNENPWPIEMSAWAISAMAPGGTAILPLPVRDTGNMPSYAVTFWPWTKPNDPRVAFLPRHILLRQDPAVSDWFKIGYGNDRGWMAYALGDTLFVSRFSMDLTQRYGDYGASCEVFTDRYLCEIESLSPLRVVPTGGVISHRETWSLHNIPGLSAMDAEEISEKIESDCLVRPGFLPRP